MEDFNLLSAEPMLGGLVPDAGAERMALSAMDRDLLIRTVIGEAAGEPLEGQAGVAHVVLNRLKSDGYGNTMKDVLFAPKQFEPWNTRRDELFSIPTDSPKFQRAAQVVDGVLSGQLADPTKGALNFANVETVRQRGNTAGMSWINDMIGNGSAIQIGRHTFGTPGSRPGASREASAAPQSYEDSQAMRGAFPLQSDSFSPMRMPNVRNVDVTQAEPQSMLGMLSPERALPGAAPLANMPTIPGAIDPGYLYQDGPKPVAGRGTLNPQITAAAERGRGPAADRPARGVALSEGSAIDRVSAPAQMPPDLSNANDAGVRDFILREAGMAPDQQPASPSRAVGGLGGLGGFVIPGGEGARSAAPAPAQPTRVAPAMAGGGFDPGDMLQAFGMSLLTGDRRNPLKNFGQIYATLSAASEKRNKSAQEEAALASALVGAGMPADQARLYSVNSEAAKLALGQIAKQQALQQEAEFNRQLDTPQRPVGGQSSSSAPAVSTPAASQPQATGPVVSASRQPMAGHVPAQQPAAATPPFQNGTLPPAAAIPQGAPSQSQPATVDQSAARLNTGNRTVDGLFITRAGKVAEYETMSRQLAAAPTDRAKAAVEGRLKAIEKNIGQIDKQIETYAPTGTMREYAFAMTQRQDRGLPPVPFEAWNPEQDKKDAVSARGAQPEEVTSLRKEVQGLPSYKNVAQAAPVYKSMLDAVSRDNRASDVNLIYGLAKIMDPTSVVRESEMTIAQAIATLPQQIQQNIKSQLGGGGRLSKEVREGIMQEAYSRVDSYRQLYDQDAEVYRGIAGRRKMDVADVLPNFGEFKPYEAPTKPKPGAGAATIPQPGTIEGGYRFKGGNPGDQSNWEPVR